MASWLKVAEDLLEVVDRRAKLVVNELADERSDSQPSAPNGQQVKARRKKSKEAHLRQSSTDTTIHSNVEQEQQSIQLSAPDVKIDRAETYPSETPLGDGTSKEEEVYVEHLYGANRDTVISDIAPSGVAHTDKRETDIDIAEAVPVTENEIETTSSSTSDGAINTNSEDLQESSSSALMDKENETTNGDRPADANPNIGSVAETTPLKVDQVSTESETVERRVISDGQENESVPLLEPPPNTNKQQEHKTEPSPNMNKQQEHKTESSPNMNKQQEHKTESSPNMHNQLEHKTGPTSVKVQDQLDEAQGLLKSAVSTGQSKEARLARVCAGLSSRLQEYKSENAQLEELLILERERATSYEAHIKQLQQDLSSSKLEVARVESNMSEALAAKNSEIESLVGLMGALKKQASASEGKLASLQENMEAIMRNRELTETRMMQALREELASAERRAEEERVAHNATKMAAVEREVELEHRAVEASNALARIQRTAEESTSRATELEHKVALLEVECASLTQELQDMEARNRRGQKKTSDEASQILQMQAWQEEVERARQGQRDAENKLSSLEAELQKMRVEMAGMKRDAEHYSRQEHMELEKRYRELTDLLYHKQTQLEAMASEKAAAEFQLEKEARRLQEAQVEAERTRASRRSAVLWEEDTDIKTLEDLPLHHRHMAGASMQLQRAAKFLDSGAVRATRFLWRYPVARILLLFYLVFVHFFLMYLLHRLQEQADDFASREVAASMGLGNSSLP